MIDQSSRRFLALLGGPACQSLMLSHMPLRCGDSGPVPDMLPPLYSIPVLYRLRAHSMSSSDCLHPLLYTLHGLSTTASSPFEYSVHLCNDEYYRPSLPTPPDHDSLAPRRLAVMACSASLAIMYAPFSSYSIRPCVA